MTKVRVKAKAFLFRCRGDLQIRKQTLNLTTLSFLRGKVGLGFYNKDTCSLVSEEMSRMEVTVLPRLETDAAQGPRPSCSSQECPGQGQKLVTLVFSNLAKYS